MHKTIRIASPFILSIAILLSSVPTNAAPKENILKLNIQDTVELGIENSILLDKVQVEIDLSNVSKKRARSAARKLDTGTRKLKDGIGELSLKEKEFEKIKHTLPPEVATQMENQLKIARQQLHQGDLKIIDSLQEAGGNISDKLNFASLDSLSVDSTKDLLTTMSNVSFEVTQASYDIYKNQIAMLIQKNYYDVLHLKKMLDVKKRAMDRGKTQYDFAKASYEEGLKAKDDFLLSNIYYKGTQIEYKKVNGEYENAILELKKSINIPLDTEIQLTGVLAEDVESFSLKEGLLSGLQNRLEIKKALGEAIVYDLNFTETKKKYTPNTYQYQEAELLKQKSELDYNQNQIEVETSILQSYNTLDSLASMLTSTKEMVSKAKENLEIAELKYKEGFGVETSLLKKLDLETSAGTIVEVLASEENLAEIEEKVVQVTYGYNLARIKYFNDIGHFIY